MASTSGTSLAHRTVSSIRTATSHSAGHSGPTSPHTPSRTITSAFASPSSLRAEEDIIVIELGSRFMRVGFAGDSVPKATLSFGPDQQRRVGDFRACDSEHQDDWRRRPTGRSWGENHEIWNQDLRDLDLGLVEDKLDRVLRDAFSRLLLIDSRPRRISLVLPSTISLPLLSTVLDTLFNRFQAPTVSLLSSAVTSAVGAGIRSALVVDLGWAETTVTSVYEYREVHTNRSVRGAKMLVEEVHGLLQDELLKSGSQTQMVIQHKETGQHSISFEECEEIACRMTWCRQSAKHSESQDHDGLPTVQEQDESGFTAPADVVSEETVHITLQSMTPPETLHLSFQRMSDPSEDTFFAPQYTRSSFDDNELPIPLLIYQHLLRLPIDARAICMSRVIFTGGCSRIPGLRRRILDELAFLVRTRGWDPVQGGAVEQLKNNAKIRRNGSRQGGNGPVGIQSRDDGGEEQDGVWHDAANATPEADPIEDILQRGNKAKKSVHGTLRCLESLGPWGGASVACQVKVVAMATIDREIWLQQGINGASRPSEVDVRAQQRQSMGPGGLMRGAASGAQANWTLGAWGSV